MSPSSLNSTRPYSTEVPSCDRNVPPPEEALMNLLILGCGKTGSLVADMARERRHHVTAIASAQNVEGSALTGDKLRDIDMVIDFTTPSAVLGNIEACLDTKKSMVV